jgi:integral membrane sensor domain MASE1
MRILLKILLFPISLILTVAVHVSAFLVGGFGAILNIISGLLFVGTLLMGGLAIFNDNFTWQPAIVLGIAAFLISPYGLPKLAEWLVVKLDDLNDLIKAI